MKKDKILILGAYSLIGKDILEGLLKHTDIKITASGRNREKLDNLSKTINGKKCSFRLLDAYNFSDLMKACRDVPVVVNCVGPYDLYGAEIAETVLNAGASYIDFAFEQIHYKKCLLLDDLARRKNQFLLTGMGITGGLSTLFIMDIIKEFPGLKDIEFFYVEGSSPDPESYFGSIMSGVLEGSLSCESYYDSKLNIYKIGRGKRKEFIPELGKTVTGLTVPTIDDLAVFSRKINLNSIKTHFYMNMTSPSMLFTILRLLKPLKNKYIYEKLGLITKKMLMENYKNHQKKNIKRIPMMKITIKTENKKYFKMIRFIDNRNATCYLPVLFLKKWRKEGINNKGIINIMDIFDLKSVLNELNNFGWKIEIEDFKETVF